MSALVFIAANISEATFEAVTAARGLEPVGDLPVVDLAVRTAPTPDQIEALAEAGVRNVLVIPAQTFFGFAGEIAKQVAERGYEAVIAPSSFGNKEVAAYVAQLLGSGLLIDVTDISQSQGRISGKKRAFAGTWETSVALDGSTFVVTLRANSVTATPAAQPGSATVIPITRELTESAVTIHSRKPLSDDGRPPLAEAAVVIAGGRGTMGEFGDLEELADLLNGAIGTTRDAVEEEWLTHDLQIGQTGVTIAPRLYIGAGISGAPHHVGGMQASTTIVAINTDEEAPLVELADIAVIGDLHEVVPALVAELKKRQ